MYKVFVQDIRLFLGGISTEIQEEGEVHSIKPQPADSLRDIVKKAGYDADIVHVQGEPDALLTRFTGEYTFVEAAGGLVKDENGRALMIFRRGKWDLPKGKAEPGETIDETALREVEEECEIKPMGITKRLSPTYHTYHEDGVDYLKKSWWFEMEGDSSADLNPQTEEDIEIVQWMTGSEIAEIADEAYGSIVDVLKEGGMLS